MEDITKKFGSAQDVRAAAQAATKKVEVSIRERKEIFESLLNEYLNLNAPEESMSEVGMLLGLPEDQFRFVAPLFLEEFAKSINNINDKINLVQLLNVSGMTIEDLRDQYDSLLEQLDKETAAFLSLQKRNFIHILLDTVYNAIAEVNGIPTRIIKIPIEICHPNAKLPAYAHPTDSGMDVYALEDITIAPGETKLIPIGIKVALPYGYELQVRPKSGRSLNSKLRVANAPGTIDAGYRDEIGIIIDNIAPPIKSITGIHCTKYTTTEGVKEEYEPICEYGSSYTIGQGEKFAQLVLCSVPKAVFTVVDTVNNIGEDRGGGFGSSGVR